MFSAILLVAAIGADQQYEPLFPRLFPIPTGQNGMEEYVRAVDLLYSQQMDTRYQRHEAAPEEVLELRTTCARETDFLARLIEAGNDKPARYVGGQDYVSSNSYRHYAVARVLWTRSDGLIALGETNKAFSTMRSLLVYGRTISGSSEVLAYIRGRNIVAYGLRGFHDYRQMIPLPVAEEIIGLTDRLLSANPLPSAIATEAEMTDKVFERHVDSQSIKTLVEDTLEIDSIAEFDANETLRELWTWLRFYRSQIQQILSGPEGNWSRELDELFVGELVSMPYGRAIAHGFTEIAPLLARSELRTRTQLRMLKLYGHLAKFRWVHQSYPSQLSQLEAGDAIIDPLTGAEFNYLNQGDTFDMYSTGIPEFGEVRVKSSRTGRFDLDPDKPA